MANGPGGSSGGSSGGAPDRVHWVVFDTAAVLAGLRPPTAGQSLAIEGMSGARPAHPAGSRDAASRRVVMDAVVTTVAPSSVFAEVKPGGPTGRALEHAVAAGLQRRDPGAQAREAAQRVARRTGDLAALSGADLDVVALGIELAQAPPGSGPEPSRRVLVFSDDHAVKNVARAAGLLAANVLATGGNEAVVWRIRCTGCGRFFEGEDGAQVERLGECIVCGSPVKRTRAAPRRR